MRNVLVLLLLALSVSAAEGLIPPYQVPKPVPTLPEKVDHVIKAGPNGIEWDKLKQAFQVGGTIVIDSGGVEVTVPLTETLLMSQRAKPILLDGLGFITFDGQGQVQAIAKEWKTHLTVQRMHFVRCRTDETGAAIRNTNFDGSLAVIDCTFTDCKTTQKGPDRGGGAIGVRGQRPLMVSNCRFVDCDASNGGAINTIQCEVYLIDCSFEKCDAFGHGGGADQGPVGQGGIGGAVYCDTVNDAKDGWQYFISGCLFTDNTAGDHAGGMFAYNNDRKGGHIFWNCHFENNTVAKDARIKHGGAIYTQHSRHLWVGNCSFHDNFTPGVDGSVFTAKNVKEEFINCEFAGNSPEFRGSGENLTMRKTSSPAWVAALGGRMPGPIDGDSPADQKRKQQEEREAAKQAAKAKRVAAVSPRPTTASAVTAVDAEARDRFAGLLRNRCQAALATGQRPAFALASMGGAAASIEAADDQQVTVRAADSSLQIPWKLLADSDRADLATWLARSNAAEDQALAAFWLRAVGKEEAAKAFQQRAGDLAAEVDAAFAKR